MSWLAGTLLVVVAAGTVVAPLERMKRALVEGDLDEAARRGELAGPAVVETALRTPHDRTAQLAGVVGAPAVTSPEQLLPALATLAAGPDRRTAIPAGRAALAIVKGMRDADRGDDTAAEDVADWRGAWLALAQRPDRWIELRVAALEIAVELGADPAALAIALADADPAMRRAVVGLAPQPLPETLRGVLVRAIVDDADPGVALGAAQSVCDELATEAAPRALDDDALARIRTLVAAGGPDVGALRDAARCLVADGSPPSLAALRSLTAHADPALRRALAELSPRR